jgi:hypothetical protein
MGATDTTSPNIHSQFKRPTFPSPTLSNALQATAPKRPRKLDTCSNCDSIGHRCTDCPNPNRVRSMLGCFRLGGVLQTGWGASDWVGCHAFPPSHVRHHVQVRVGAMDTTSPKTVPSIPTPYQHIAISPTQCRPRQPSAPSPAATATPSGTDATTAPTLREAPPQT